MESHPYMSTAISRQLLDHAVDVNKAIAKMMVDSFLHPPTKEEIAARQAARQAEWDQNTASGLVPIADYSDEGQPSWEQVGVFDHVDRWVTQESWDRYSEARRILEAAEEGLVASDYA